MAQNFAIVRTTMSKAEIQAIPLPHLPDDYILVRTVAVALNPTDWQTLDAQGLPGSIMGCDYAGVVEEVGSAVTRKFVKGDRIAGVSHGGNDANHQTGAFARYIIVKGDIQQHIPPNVTFEAACTVGAGLVTVGYALYKVLGLPWPARNAKPTNGDILIYGGSTATGTLAIQFAKLSGMRVTTTTSPRNFELVKRLGADAVYDYHDTDHGLRIRNDTDSQLSLVLDCVSTNDTAAACAKAIGTAGGKYANLLGPDCPRADVKSIFFLGYSVSGESYISEGEHYNADPDFFARGVKFAKHAEMLWLNGAFVPHPARLEEGGLNGILESGLQIMKEGKYSGEKLVYRMEESTWPSSG